MAYVQLSDVATEVGRAIESPEAEQVQAWINRVEARILARIPDVNDRIVTEGEYATVLRGVVVDVVARKVRNPDGFRSERIDDYYYDRGTQPTDLTMTDAEWAELGATSSVGAFSTRPGFVPDGVPREVWL